RAAQRRRPRRPRLAALFSEILVPPDGHDVRRKTGLLAHRLQRRGVDTLAHLRVAVENLEPSTVDHADDDVAALDGAVAQPGALDAAADALVGRALVDRLDRFQRLANAPDALAH